MKVTEEDDGTIHISECVGTLGLRFEEFTPYTEIEQAFRDKFPELTKDKKMIRCFEGVIKILHSFWQAREQENNQD